MKYKKRPRPHDKPPPWNPYLIQRMGAEEATPLLWTPQVLKTIPASEKYPYSEGYVKPIQPYEYAIAVEVDGESSNILGTKYTWLILTWLIIYSHGTPYKRAECKITLMGNDDYNYGAWLAERGGQSFIDTWALCLSFIDQSGAAQFGLNGEYLLEYCDEYLGAYERDYN